MSRNMLQGQLEKDNTTLHKGYYDSLAPTSSLWRSILWGRQIICAGSRWRIGNGQDVHIHKANWIPKPFTFKPVIKPTLPSKALVSELINGENCWDEELIYRHFDKMDADVITQIPLPRRSREDELIWHFGKSGQYTVKSGYQTALNIRFPAMPSSSEFSKNEWNIIWSLALPKKIRIFVWRAAKNLLPSDENLWKRKIVQEPTCQLCKMGIENVFHALVDCKAAKKVWRLSLFDNDIQAAPGQDILSLLHGVKRMRSNADVDLFAAMLWAKWNARNQWLFKGKRENPQSVVAKAEAVMEAYKRVQPSADLGWNPPQEGFVKINTDAATNSEKNLAGLGAVIRDENGQVTATAIKVSKFHGSVAYAEAEAMEWGLQVAKDAHVKDVIMESDSQEVVSLVNNRQGSRSEIYWVVLEIQKLKESFDHEKPLNSMFGVDLSYNKFTGEIPLQIGYLFRIRALNRSHDNLIGSIPPTFSNLKQIESLDLYNNKFNGKIPPQLVELIALAVFTVWYTITYQIRSQSGRHNLQRLTRVATTEEILFFVDCHCPGVAMKTDHYHQSQKMMIIVSLTWAVSTSLL
ncbi:putative reverse transcriptase/RNA-dependent DNA polymerase [Citrus sinensis]|nr:putative reverse transcriptase/RNA-dependent DNA polymerase [Citrus sinensis]